MKIILLLSVTLFSIVSGFVVHAKAKHKVVFLHGSRSHASGDHEFQAGSHLLAKHLNAQEKVDVEAVVNAGWPEDESILDDADAIVIVMRSRCFEPFAHANAQSRFCGERRHETTKCKNELMKE